MYITNKYTVINKGDYIFVEVELSKKIADDCSQSFIDEIQRDLRGCQGDLPYCHSGHHE